MKTYRVAVTWTAWKDIYIEAESEDEANIKAANLTEPEQGTPFERSLHVDGIWDDETRTNVGPTYKFAEVYKARQQQRNQQ